MDDENEPDGKRSNAVSYRDGVVEYLIGLWKFGGVSDSQFAEVRERFAITDEQIDRVKRWND